MLLGKAFRFSVMCSGQEVSQRLPFSLVGRGGRPRQVLGAHRRLHDRHRGRGQLLGPARRRPARHVQDRGGGQGRGQVLGSVLTIDDCRRTFASRPVCVIGRFRLQRTIGGLGWEWRRPATAPRPGPTARPWRRTGTSCFSDRADPENGASGACTGTRLPTWSRPLRGLATAARGDTPLYARFLAATVSECGSIMGTVCGRHKCSSTGTDYKDSPSLAFWSHCT